MVSTDDIVQVQRSCRHHNMLLTTRAEKYIRKGIKLGESLCCHPYTWQDAQGCPEFTASKLQILGWIFNIILSSTYLIFLFVQSIRVYTSPDELISDKAIIIFASVLFFIPVLFQATWLWAGENFSNYVRSSITYLHKFEERYVRDTARPSTTAKIGGIFMTCMYYGLAVDAILFTLYGLTRLDSPEQVSSLVSGYPIVQIPVCILFCTYYYAGYAANSCAIAFTSMGILFSFFDVIKELGKDESDFSTGTFRRPSDHVRVYRVLQLQVDATDRVYCIITAFAQNLFMLLVMFGTYGAIRLDGIVAVALGLVGVTCAGLLVVFLGTWGELESGSSKAVSSIRTMTARSDVLENKKLQIWLSKSARSLRVARLPVCGMYFIDKQLILTAVSAISDGIIFLLLTF